MFNFPANDYALLLHQILMFFSTIFSRIAMFLSRSESFKWIRKRFLYWGNPHNNNSYNITNNNNNNNNNNSTANTTRPPEGEEYIATLQLSNNSNNNASANNNNDNNENHLAEVLVVNDTKIDAPSTLAANGELDVILDAKNGNEANSVMSGRHCNVISAPIAREEEIDCEANNHEENVSASASAGADAGGGAGAVNEVVFVENECKMSISLLPKEAENIENTVRRSKSRVRTYLKKCKDRLTGQHHHAAVTAAAVAVEKTLQSSSNECQIITSTAAAADELAANVAIAAAHESLSTLCVVAEEDDDNAYEDIDFSLSSILPNNAIDNKLASLHCVDSHRHSGDDDNDDASTNNVNVNEDNEARQAELQHKSLVREEHLARTIQMESGITTLIDSYLAHIYPVYFECTRAILIRQARDLLVCSYHGCLQMFEQKFLCKFAQIAMELKMKHIIGESLIWSQGWPLATPTGELILHLGALDDALLRPAEIYLCIKTVDNSDTAATPQLHAVWRSAQSEATTITTTATASANNIKSRCIDHSDPKAYLSILTIEMLSDELPQLLQNLLVGVERTIGRISLNELQMSQFGDHDQQLQHQQQQLQQQQQQDEANGNNNANNNNSNSNLQARSNITNSPKCALRRSELITKNKMLNNKFMLRRLTNRQDSMNSTSSGNSCASSGSSASSDELFHCNRNGSSINNNDVAATLATTTTSAAANAVGAITAATTTKSASISPALPLFCLGNSFPHIDSDEENSDEKRNSLVDDQFETEIIPPSSITEIPDKLLTTGIYLPGTRDLKGHPIITIDAEIITTAGLNCYEIATVLLFYSTIPESNSNSNAYDNSKQHTENSALANNAALIATTNTTTTTIATQPAPQETFTILIAIEKSQHLCVIDLICQSLKLLTRHFMYCEILAVCIERSLLQLCKNNSTTTTTTTTTNGTCDKKQLQPQPQSQQQAQQLQLQQKHSVKFISVDEVTTSVAPSQIPYGKLRGLHHHDARKWCEFFSQLEPFQSQCTAAGQRLVAAMSDIRSADLQGLPTRRQLYAQHRALSRALMDSELHNLRKRGAMTLTRLQELAKYLNSSHTSNNNNNNNNHSYNSNSNTGNNKMLSTAATAAATTITTAICSNYSFNTNSHLSNHQQNHNNNSLTKSKETNTKTKTTSSSAMLLSTSSNGNTTTTATATSITNRLSSTTSSTNSSHNRNNVNSSYLNSTNMNCNSNSNSNIDVAIRLHKVTLLFNEVDRAAKRLEQLTEQRRERLRELTRQRALEDEINEVTSWITSDGNETLQRFANIQLDCESAIKEHEEEFEKYYFISMKHLAKGRDLHAAAANMDALSESALNLKAALDCFAEKLEQARERIEGASRLHHLMSLHMREESVQQEMERLAEHIGMSSLLNKCRQQKEEEQQLQQQQQQQQRQEEHASSRVKPNSLNLNSSRSTTKQAHALLFNANSQMHNQNHSSSSSNNNTHAQKPNRSSHRSSSGNGSFDGQTCHCWRESRNLEEMDDLLDAEEDEDGEEEQSKIADSGLGGCDRCEGNMKLTRTCSCQSLNETNNLYDKSDELDDECFERPSKRYLDIHSPIEANAHLQCHASNLELPEMEELSCLDPKIQKTLLLIMREMIGTERDYVRSLYYVIENYVDELLRDDIPQPLRGQRNVIFGNIEKIFEFHNSHFLSELERYERNPLKVGAAFLEMENKFYLYALYNKNKPKSDTLMSEYGTAFFKSKQFELADKMDLASYLLKPVQRMGKYALLLQQLVKACSVVEGAALQEIAADVEELQRAEEMVKFQLRHGNDLLAMDSLRDCDVNVKEQGRLVRQNEFLVWQGRGGKKTLRQIFLFEELVLFSKARRFPDHKNLDIYIYKNSIKTSDIGLTAHVGDSATKFEIWFRKRKPEDTWTMQCMSEDIKNAWTEEVSKLLWKQAKRNREIRLAEMSSMGIGSKPCLDIRPSNNQINDRSITITQLGKAPKLRHSFVGSHMEQNKTSKRPNSLISESSLSSGTSSSSLSSTGHERSAGRTNANNHALELINETQALMLKSDNHNHISNSSNNTNTLSSSSSSGAGSGSGSGSGGGGGGANNLRNHKRSTTLVSQLSMESGILSDISMTPDQEQQPDTTIWSSATAGTPTSEGTAAATTTMTTTVIMRRHRTHKSNSKSHSNSNSLSTTNSANRNEIMNIEECMDSDSNPYLKDKEESVHL